MPVSNGGGGWFSRGAWGRAGMVFFFYQRGDGVGERDRVLRRTVVGRVWELISRAAEEE